MGPAVRERLGDAYSPYSPYSPDSPYVPGQGAGVIGVGSGQPDYFSSREIYNRTTGLPHAPQPPQYHHNRDRCTQDPELDLGPGCTSHFLYGSYPRTATNSEPTTRANTNSVPSPRSEEEVDEYNTGSGGGGMVAYGHGYDATRQRMIYRRILAIDQEISAGGGGVDRGYEGGDEDTETGTSNSGIGSASASGRTSPYEERGRPRRGSSWWAMGYGFGSSLGRGGRRRRGISDESVETETTEGPHGEYYGEVDQQHQHHHHLLGRPGWSVGAIDGLAPSPVSPAVTAIRYGSNDNTPRLGHILDVVHGSAHAGGVSEETEPRHGERESATDPGSSIEQGGGEVHTASSGLDDIILLPPALDSGSEIDLSPSSAAAAELEQLRSGNVSRSLVDTSVQPQMSPAAIPPAQDASVH
ncbi:hypothetical protein L211DRAFT_846778 [Terfezia boudieri ATCC MYA-4762]|uniref:Uncharacterized protein n=1 Tax=Terfezia boudieri ATCC MYA-4762 TaxID=1051890 RepID=A0A3N4M082_9PEZI|nr:hypothetical protein L211DRAFT_846778 [Terfezia boudieri ATCC MYA-4762]